MARSGGYRNTPGLAIVDPGASSSPESRVEGLLAEILRVQQAILKVLERQQRPGADDDAAFIVALASSVGSRVFSSSALLAHAQVDDTLRSALGDTTPRRLGKRLARLEGHEVAGFVVSRIKREWCVQVRAHLQQDAGVRSERGV